MKPGPMSQVIALALTAMAAGSACAGGDPTRGADLFQQNCSACHSVKQGQNQVGPSLFAVVGRPAASISDFSYSDAMSHSGILWTAEKLMAYLKAPRRFIPGVKMLFPGLPEDRDREDVVAFLSTVRGPAPANVSTADSPTRKASGESN